MKPALLGILVAIEATIVILAALWQPENAGFVFWFSILWISLLVAINWMASVLVFSPNTEVSSQTATIFGALPAINVFLFIYSAFSITILIATTFFNTLNWNFQITFQLIGLAIFLIISLIVFVSFKGAQHGSYSQYSKQDIIVALEKLERSATNVSLRKKIEGSISFVKYNMPHPSTIAQNELDEVFKLMSTASSKKPKNIEKALAKLQQL